MIGDIILALNRLFRECFCIHDYRYSVRPCGLQEFEIGECKKCGRVTLPEISANTHVEAEYLPCKAHGKRRKELLS